jgi:glucose/arabinose dehydrogenase
MITLFALLQVAAGGAVLTEADAYALDRYHPPEGAVLEVGGMGFMPDGALMASTRRGQVWRVEDALGADAANARMTLFAEGLYEGLGMSVVDGELYVLQRGELSRLRDVDGDKRCDAIDTITDDWGLSGNYHEFAFGLPRDAAGNWYVSLNVSFFDDAWWHGRSTVPHRGWVLRVSPDGVVEPFASGFRSPCGIALDSRGRMFVTDNQGDWVASSPIYHVREGAFYGHPKSLVWTQEYRTNGLTPSDEIPPARAYTGREPAAIWIPYKWSRSTGNLVEITRDGEHGLGELFAGQFVVAELTNGMLLRAGFEEVQGVTQGWVLPLRTEMGSVVRVLEAPDGTIMCGLTNRGWGGEAPADGLARVRWTGRTPFEIHSMRIVDAEAEESHYGFELTFTRPVAADWTPAARLITYDYDYWWEYGSPERHTTEHTIDSFEWSADRKRLVVRTEGLLPAMATRLRFEGCVADDGAPLLHNEISYTINQLPSGPMTNALVAKIVPPPPTKGAEGEGILHLSWGDALGQFDAPGWQLVSATLDSETPTKFRVVEGNGALIGEKRLRSKGEFGSAHVHLEFMLAEGGEALIGLMGLDRALHVIDDENVCGTFVELDPSGRVQSSTAPTSTVYHGAGEWHELDLFVTGARMGDDGSFVPTRVERALLDDVVLHEGIDCGNLVSGGPQPTQRRALVVTPITPGRVALRNIQVRPLDRPIDDRTWERIDVAVAWDAWESRGDANWELEGREVVGKGALGHLFLTGLEDGSLVRFEAKVNDNGAAALVVEAQQTEAGVAGTPLCLNSSFPNGRLTGTIGDVAITTELVAANTWVEVQLDYRVGGPMSIGDDPESTRYLVVSLNGVEVNKVKVDRTTREHCPLALRVDHDGTVVRFRNFAVVR